MSDPMLPPNDPTQPMAPPLSAPPTVDPVTPSTGDTPRQVAPGVAWVRPVFLNVLTLVAVLVFSFGAYSTVVGGVHLAFPQIVDDDSFISTAGDIARVADAAGPELIDALSGYGGVSSESDFTEYACDEEDDWYDEDDCDDAKQEYEDYLDEVKDDQADAKEQMAKVIGPIKSALDKEARRKAINGVLGGVVMMGIGFLLYRRFDSEARQIS